MTNGNQAEKSIIRELRYQNSSNIKKKKVGILYNKILRNLKTQAEVTSLYKNLLNFQQKVENFSQKWKICIKLEFEKS